LEISRRQAAALEKVCGLPVRVGMRHWHPFIADVVRDLGEPIVGFPLAPQFSRASVGEYHRVLRQSTSKRLILVHHWHRQEKFLQAWADRIPAGLSRPRAEVLLFPAHSVPEDPDDPYPNHLQETIDGILPLLPPVRWEFAYQSASSAPLKWRGPDVDTRLGELRSGGVASVLAAPISFIAD